MLAFLHVPYAKLEPRWFNSSLHRQYHSTSVGSSTFCAALQCLSYSTGRHFTALDEDEHPNMNCFNLVRVFTQFNFLQTEMFQRIFGFVKSYAKLLMPKYKTAGISEGIFMTSQRFAYYKCSVIHLFVF